MVQAVVAVASTTAKSEVIKRVVANFRTGIAGIFGDTPTDKERKAAAADALGRALNGDPSGEAYLLARAGIRADANVKVAPESARRIFRAALRTFYQASGKTPAPDIAKALSISTVPTDTVLPMLPMNGAGLPSFGPGPLDTGTSTTTPMTAGTPGWVLPAIAIYGVAFLLFKRGSRR